MALSSSLKLRPRARTPARSWMVEVLKLAGPSVICWTNLLPTARQLPGRSLRSIPIIHPVPDRGSKDRAERAARWLPAERRPRPEAQRCRGAHAARKSLWASPVPWMPASGDETYEIIRRRLFQMLDSDGERARDETIKAFHDLYKKNSAEFPPEVRESRYYDLLRMSYPIHPELFDRCRKLGEPSQLPAYARRVAFHGERRCVLWHERVHDPQSPPVAWPISNERIAQAFFIHRQRFCCRSRQGGRRRRRTAGPDRGKSTAAHLAMRAATRAARAVFLCSAPLVGRPNAGLSGPGLRLACAEPGDQLAIFGERSGAEPARDLLV